MKSARLYPVILLAGVLALAGCDYQHKSSESSTGVDVLAPSSSSGASMLGTWASTQSASGSTAASSSSCSSFVWTVTSQTATDISGSFTAVCLGTANITGTGTGHVAGTTVNLAISGNGSMPGIPTCAFSVSGIGTINGDTITVPYSGSTCLGPLSGTQILARSLIQATTPTPAPAPAPPPPPPPPPPSSNGDVLSQATIVNSPSDLAQWPITTQISSLNLAQDGVHAVFSKQDGSDRWPGVPVPALNGGEIQYTLGMCLTISSRWYCSAAVEFWYGLPAAGGPPSEYAQNWFYDPARWAPMTGHQPAPGETIGFFACAGDCRNNRDGTLSPVRERTNVVLVPMPGAGGGFFSF